MRLIAITFPEFIPGEANDIRCLLDAGWERVHIRKPGSMKSELENLLRQIPDRYYPMLSLHDHHDLASRFGLGGIHLNGRNPNAPDGWEGLVSRSCHSVSELREWSRLDYLFLSPVYDSISKPGYNGRFDLHELSHEKLDRVFALGGVTPSRLPEIEAIGFTGAAMLSCAWK